MDDFSPAVIARKVKGVRELLEARTQLDNLLTHMDGKSGAEDLISKLINDENMMQALASAPKPGSEEQEQDSGDPSSEGEE
jgi:type VI secretion system protein ImpB